MVGCSDLLLDNPNILGGKILLDINRRVLI